MKRCHSDRMWAGVAHNAPNAKLRDYVLTGHVRIECPGGRTVLDGRPGDFLFIPVREVHREGNPTDGTSDVVLVRAGKGEVVVSVDGPA